MENENYDRNKVIGDMNALETKILEGLERVSKERGENKFDREAIKKQVTVKYLGKIEITNEQGKIEKRDWYAVIEQHSGRFQITYYDENQNRLGRTIRNGCKDYVFFRRTSS